MYARRGIAKIFHFPANRACYENGFVGNSMIKTRLNACFEAFMVRPYGPPATLSAGHGFLYWLQQLSEQIAGVWDESYSKSEC